MTEASHSWSTHQPCFTRAPSISPTSHTPSTYQSICFPLISTFLPLPVVAFLPLFLSISRFNLNWNIRMNVRRRNPLRCTGFNDTHTHTNLNQMLPEDVSTSFQAIWSHPKGWDGLEITAVVTEIKQKHESPQFPRASVKKPLFL